MQFLRLIEFSSPAILTYVTLLCRWPCGTHSPNFVYVRANSVAMVSAHTELFRGHCVCSRYQICAAPSNSWAPSVAAHFEPTYRAPAPELRTSRCRVQRQTQSRQKPMRSIPEPGPRWRTTLMMAAFGYRRCQASPLKSPESSSTSVQSIVVAAFLRNLRLFYALGSDANLFYNQGAHWRKLLITRDIREASSRIWILRGGRAGKRTRYVWQLVGLLCKAHRSVWRGQ